MASQYLVSIDAGNGFIKAFGGKLGNKSFRPKRVGFPAMRALTTGDSLGLGDDLEINADYAGWRARKYLFGDDVQYNRDAIDAHMGADRYGNEQQHFYYAAATAMLGVKKGGVHLVTFAPPSWFQQAKTAIQQRLQVSEPDTVLQFRSDAKPRKWQYDAVTMLPEGAAAALCFALDDAGQRVDTDVLNGRMLIIDIGMYTVDFIVIQDGRINPEALTLATKPGWGVRHMLLDPVTRKLRQQGRDFSLTQWHDVERVLRNGQQAGAYILTAGRSSYDIKPALDYLTADFAERLANNVIDTEYNGLVGFNSCVVIGGYAGPVAATLRDFYGDTVRLFSDYPQTRDIHPVDANAAAGLRFALARINAEA